MNATSSASVQYDLVVRNAVLPDGRAAMDIAVRDGQIAAVAPHAELAGVHGATELDAQGQLVSPPFVDAHFHMDATLSYGLPRVNASGTLLEGIALWGELKPSLTLEALVDRALQYCDWAVGRGLLAIRSHVDICDPRLLAVDALIDVRERVAPVSRPAAGRVSAGRVPARGRSARQSRARARQGRRRGRRDTALNNNFARGDGQGPTLLSLDDVRTLFHEFGHGLHGLLSDVHYERLSGTQVLRDFVELPSQLFEHWIDEPEVLKRHALHHKTGEPIPDLLIERVRAARRFGQAYESVRYTASALVDMAAHAATEPI